MTDAVAGNYSCIATWFVNHRVADIVYSVLIEKGANLNLWLKECLLSQTSLFSHIALDAHNDTLLITIDQPNTAINASRYELNCYTSPDTNMAIVWQKNGIIISHQNSLKFDVISTNDGGLYTCALGQNNLVNQTVSVQVLGKLLLIYLFGGNNIMDSTCRAVERGG